MAVARRYGDAHPFTERLSRFGGDGVDFIQWLDRVVRGGTKGSEIAEIAREFSIFVVAPLRWQWLRRRLMKALYADARQASARRAQNGQLRTLWGVTPINNMILCSRSDRLLGNESDTLVFATYYITSGFDIVLSDPEKWMAKNHPELRPAFRWLVFVWALLRYDVFHYFNDAGILANVGGYSGSNFGISLTEMEVLKASDKRLFTYVYGADYRSRKKTMAKSPYNFCTFCTEIGKHCICDDDHASRMFAVIGRYADALVATGLAMEQIPGAVDLHYLVIDTANLSAEPVLQSETPLRIAHVPNHPFFKGTHLLQAAVEQLRSEGVPIELKMLSGVPYGEVIEHMISCDIVADQFISGWYGSTSLEAMALGRPVLCYLREGINAVCRDELPIVNTYPEKIADTLRDLVRYRDRLPDIGARSRAYVERYHSVVGFSDRLRQLYIDRGRLGPTILNRLQVGHGSNLINPASARDNIPESHSAQ